MQDSELRLAVEDAPPAIKRCAAVIVQQREQRATRAAVEQALRQPEVQRLVRGMIERNQRKPVYAGAPAGMIIRQQQPDLRAMQANLQSLKRRGAELTRQAARERRGW